MAVRKKNFRVGDKVYYQPEGSSSPEIGIVKSMGLESVFVVYHCGGDWKNYKNYTGASTHPRDLHFGWEPLENQIKSFLNKYGEICL